MAGEPGFEPGLAESESAGLPLTYSPTELRVRREARHRVDGAHRGRKSFRPAPKAGAAVVGWAYIARFPVMQLSGAGFSTTGPHGCAAARIAGVPGSRKPRLSGTGVRCFMPASSSACRGAGRWYTRANVDIETAASVVLQAVRKVQTLWIRVKTGRSGRRPETRMGAPRRRAGRGHADPGAGATALPGSRVPAAR